MSLLLILRKIWKYKLVTIPICLLVLAGGFYVVAVTAPTYEASATYTLLPPEKAVPTETDIARDPALAKVHANNPYTQFSDQSVLVQLLASLLNSDENRADLIKKGADPNYLAQPSAEFGFSAPILQITGMGTTPTAAIRSTALVGEDLTAVLDKMQADRGVDKPYRITTEAVVPATDAKLKPSGKLRALVAVMVLGLIMLFMAISVLDALAALRAEWAQRRHDDDDDGGPGVEASFVPPLTLHSSADDFVEPNGEARQWPPLEAQR